MLASISHSISGLYKEQAYTQILLSSFYDISVLGRRMRCAKGREVYETGTCHSEVKES